MNTRWLPFAAIGAAFVVVGLVSQTPGRGAPLDPNGTGPTGAKALVLLLRSYGADVRIVDGTLPPSTATAVVLTDEMDDARRTELAQWVHEGGRLVVTDPVSTLQIGAPSSVTTGFSTKSLQPDGPCPLLGLGGIGRLDVGPSLFLRRRPGTNQAGCFTLHVSEGAQSGDASFLLTESSGRGTVVGLGGAGVWTNALLDHDDNAALAIALLAPADGTRVAVLVASPVGSGKQSAYKLLGPRVKLALLQLLVAFAVLALWQGRRLGRPVPESQPVPLAGSEIVVAVGELLQRTDNRDAAARQLRAGARRWLGERLGLGSRAPADQLAHALSTRGRIDPQRVEGLLSDTPVPDVAALVRLAESLSQLRTEVSRGPSQ